MKILYFGGQKSGKSRLSAKRALELSTNKAYYIATYDNSYNDKQMNERILKHINDRQNDFISIEEAFDLPSIILENNTYLIDCITMWIFNNMNKGEEFLLNELKKLSIISANIIFVLNDVSSGIIPLDKQSREFVDLSGIVGQYISSFCDEVVEVKYGLEKRLK